MFFNPSVKCKKKEKRRAGGFPGQGFNICFMRDQYNAK